MVPTDFRSYRFCSYGATGIMVPTTLTNWHHEYVVGIAAPLFHFNFLNIHHTYKINMKEAQRNQLSSTSLSTPGRQIHEKSRQYNHLLKQKELGKRLYNQVRKFTGTLYGSGFFFPKQNMISVPMSLYSNFSSPVYPLFSSHILQLAAEITCTKKASA